MAENSLNILTTTQATLDQMCEDIRVKLGYENVVVGWKIEGGSIQVIIDGPESLQYIENGRGPGKFPPPTAIEDWIVRKNILPREQNGHLPTIKQLSFLIGRKIAEQGVEGKHHISETTEEIYIYYKERIVECIDFDICTYIKNNFLK